jgi:hypothetical protein
VLRDTVDPTPAHECIRCGDEGGRGAGTYCPPCLWVVRAEIEEGFCELEEHLRKAARFEAWLREHERGHE